ncbi:MAG: transposase [Candidatus Micrarchaeia archaeon]|jgi:transposase
MSFIRKVKVGETTYLSEVKSVRENGKVRQKFIRYLGKEFNGKPQKRVLQSDVTVKSVKRSLDVLAVDAMAKDLGINEIANKHALALIYAHLLENRSINTLETWLKFTEIPEVLGLESVSTKNLYESLSDVSEGEFTLINQRLTDTFRKLEPLDEIAVIDVTDTYFEGKNTPIKRRRGKDGKIGKLIQLGLAVSFQYGFPIHHQKYQGNLNNTQIYKDMILTLREQNRKCIIVDRGMSSDENIKLAHALNAGVIAGLRKTQTIEKKYLETIQRNEIYSREHRVVLKNTTVFVKGFPFEKGRLVVVYNPLLEAVKREHAFSKENGSDDIYAGYSLVYHNTNYSDAEVIKKYYEKDIVERAFKQMKGVLKLRPIRVWLQDHVDAHVKICYLAYAILAYMNFKLIKTKTSAVQALSSLRYGYRVQLSVKGSADPWPVYVPLEPQQKNFLKALGVVVK